MNWESIHPDYQVALTQLLDAFPGGFNAPETIHERRTLINGALALNPVNEKVTREDRFIPVEGAPDVRIRIYRPKESSYAHPQPAIFTIHGGGMVTGNIEADDANAAALCERSGALTVAIDYRLAPEHPFPAAINDCYAVANWLFENVAELDVDATRIALHGGSAGGGLAIGLALMMRDRGNLRFCFLMAIYPMIDDRHITASSKAITNLGVWDRKASLESWAWYLGDAYGSDDISPYAAPIRATHLEGLPPTFIDVGTHDLFLDEDREFAERLEAAGVPVEFHINEGAYHAAELFARDVPPSQLIWSKRFDALKKALG
ncbi:MAG: alpha/beta hydrolase [Actinobacteria bacterium]|jgi:acetyl esterase/lipase|nr:alpha/beta hydrolase [Actinomycetota bacterium]